MPVSHIVALMGLRALVDDGHDPPARFALHVAVDPPVAGRLVEGVLERAVTGHRRGIAEDQLSDVDGDSGLALTAAATAAASDEWMWPRPAP